MYLRFQTRLTFPELAQALCPDLTEDMIDWDRENVYEWMYLGLPQLEFSLHVSREHGWADVSDEVIDQCEKDNQKLSELIHPGPVFVSGWNRRTSTAADSLPDFLPNFIANRLSLEVAVCAGRVNVELPDEGPIFLVGPNLGQAFDR